MVLLTENLACLIGVRQGENLSSLLFSLYLNDLQQFLQEAHMGSKEIRDKLLIIIFVLF